MLKLFRPPSVIPSPANWRITFRYDAGKHQLYDMDYEDYH